MHALSSTASTMREREIRQRRGSRARHMTRRAASITIGSALMVGLVAGLSACSSAPQQVTPTRSTARTSTSTAGGGENPGGGLHLATPAERTKALSSFGATNPAEVWATGSYNPMTGVRRPKDSLLSHLLSSLPATDLPEVSNNWSGYQVLAADTKVTATEASGSWVVPAVSAPTKRMDGYSSIWVGIGGSCLDAACHVPDQTLIQLGTAEDASPSGTKLYYAWYELLPAASVDIKSLEVAPGDSVSASLSLVGPKRTGASYNLSSAIGHGSYNPMSRRGGGVDDTSSTGTMTWLLSIRVTSPSGPVQQWSKTLSYTSSLASAEWVVEGPSASCNGTIGELPLADYHSVSFSDLVENSKAIAPGISNLVIGYDPYGELSLPAPSFLLQGKTGTYYLPFVAKSSKETAGQATCNTLGVWGGR